MATIITRAGKGTPLTNNEVDANFTNLNTDKAEFSDSAGLRGLLSDATGTGSAVFAIDPTFASGIESSTSSFNLLNDVATTINAFQSATVLIIGANSGTTTVQNDIHCLGDIQADSSSDERLKDNIQIIPDALNKLKSLRGVTWKWNDLYKAEKSGKTDVCAPEIGVIAQDVIKDFPELVRERSNGYLAVEYTRLIAVLIEAVKELSDEVDSLRNKIG